jgi:DNA-binding XRE family transcriptional regulator
MKLERLEELKKISTKDVIVRQTLNNVEKKYYHNKYELKISLALTLFNLLGNTEMHKAMEAEDINWIDFINDNYSLIEELEKGEYSKEYEEIFREIEEGAKAKAKYSLTLMSVLEDLGQSFTEENINKIKELLESKIEEVEKVNE